MSQDHTERMKELAEVRQNEGPACDWSFHPTSAGTAIELVVAVPLPGEIALHDDRFMNLVQQAAEVYANKARVKLTTRGEPAGLHILELAAELPMENGGMWEVRRTIEELRSIRDRLSQQLRACFPSMGPRP